MYLKFKDITLVFFLKYSSSSLIAIYSIGLFVKFKNLNILIRKDEEKGKREIFFVIFILLAIPKFK